MKNIIGRFLCIVGPIGWAVFLLLLEHQYDKPAFLYGAGAGFGIFLLCIGCEIRLK